MDGKYFKLHRQSVVNTFHQNGMKTGVIVYSSPDVQKEPFSDSDLSFSQEALFYWLTGWSNPNTHIIIDIATGKSTLVTYGYNEYYEIWTGPIPTNEEIIGQTGVDNIIDRSEMVKYVQNLNPSKIYSTTVPLKDFQNVDQYTLLIASNICRRVKFPHEVEWLRTASQITGETIKKVLKKIKPPMKESDIESLFKYKGSQLGCNEVSFLTIVASGQNSVYLHYTSNSGVVKEGDLVLLDCGLFYKHYAGDITRTFPANGKFSEEQKLVYNSLLKQQINLCKAVKPGFSFSLLDSMMYKSIFEVCKEVGVVSNDAVYSFNIAQLFCPHSVSHSIGCNVHDQALFYFGDDIFRANMVVSVEPGIYFNRKRIEKSRSNPLYAGINFDRTLELADKVGGIRIEDDVLVTEDGCEVLSACCPKTIEEIEDLMKKSK